MSFCRMMPIHPKRAEPWPATQPWLGAFFGISTPLDQDHQQVWFSHRAVRVRQPRPTKVSGTACSTGFLAFHALEGISEGPSARAKAAAPAGYDLKTRGASQKRLQPTQSRAN